MAASVQLMHLLLPPITLTPQMVRRRVGIASVDESMWTSLFSSCTEHTYLDTSSVPPQWSVTIASTRCSGSPVVLPSHICDAPAPGPRVALSPGQGQAQEGQQAATIWRPPERPTPVSNSLGPLKRSGGGRKSPPGGRYHSQHHGPRRPPHRPPAVPAALTPPPLKPPPAANYTCHGHCPTWSLPLSPSCALLGPWPSPMRCEKRPLVCPGLSITFSPPFP